MTASTCPLQEADVFWRSGQRHFKRCERKRHHLMRNWSYYTDKVSAEERPPISALTFFVCPAASFLLLCEVKPQWPPGVITRRIHELPGLFCFSALLHELGSMLWASSPAPGNFPTKGFLCCCPHRRTRHGHPARSRKKTLLQSAQREILIALGRAACVGMQCLVAGTAAFLLRKWELLPSTSPPGRSLRH